MSVGVRGSGGPELDADLLDSASAFAGPFASGAGAGAVPFAVRLRAIVERHDRVGLAIKRALDVTVAAIGLILCTPLLAVLGALVRLDSRGPAIFWQARVGRGEQPFTLAKLRTMHADGRVTRVGRLLRPTGLDELPQLWNVLKGDMSLVGPRPEETPLVVRYESELPRYSARHLMRPGITGLAQVNGMRGQVSIADRLQFDLRYLRTWSLALDALILWRTASTIWRDTVRALRS